MMNAAAGVAVGNPFDLKATIYCYDEHGFELLKENTVLRIPAFLQYLANFKQFVFEIAGIASILEEVGFREFDMLLYRLTADNEKYVIRTQHQYSTALKFFSDASDRLEVMVCRKVMACVKGRPGSILIVPTEPGVTPSQRKSNVQTPVYFRRDEQPYHEPPHPHTPPEPTLPLTSSAIGFPGRKRKKDPKKKEDESLFESIKRTDFVERNKRQQAVFDELTAMLKDLSGSVPVSEGKFICGICNKERLVCPNRNNIGRVRYFRRKHYDNCLSSEGKGNYRTVKLLSDLGMYGSCKDNSISHGGGNKSEEGSNTDRGPTAEKCPRGDNSVVMKTSDTADGDMEIVYVKQETLVDIKEEHIAQEEH